MSYKQIVREDADRMELMDENCEIVAADHDLTLGVYGANCTGCTGDCALCVLEGMK